MKFRKIEERDIIGRKIVRYYLDFEEIYLEEAIEYLKNQMEAKKRE